MFYTSTGPNYVVNVGLKPLFFLHQFMISFFQQFIKTHTCGQSRSRSLIQNRFHIGTDPESVPYSGTEFRTKMDPCSQDPFPNPDT